MKAKINEEKCERYNKLNEKPKSFDSINVTIININHSENHNATVTVRLINS